MQLDQDAAARPLRRAPAVGDAEDPPGERVAAERRERRAEDGEDGAEQHWHVVRQHRHDDEAQHDQSAGDAERCGRRRAQRHRDEHERGAQREEQEDRQHGDGDRLGLDVHGVSLARPSDGGRARR
ncbi:hypothetical protein [Microbacterium aurum]